ncbi:ABC transporter permease [Hymenobacter sp. BT507]|uniref:ABC transporter permease n=1 Tax=Hymenobacter citatus TaxID=2763506 RepID=A0ABR7MN83_9BACT|nr:M1 family aminopeptidase [Hymenobacter citatus]MBC6612526.1 ABC transporter permease [Hymenobacter citatus]
MFLAILRFELWYRLRRPATYIYFFILLAISLLMMLMTGGFFEGVTASVGNSKVYINSPFALNGLISVLTIVPGVLIISAMFGPAVLRDFDSRMHPLLYTSPISKAGYLGGRFFGTLLITLLVLSGIGVGLWIGTLFPGVNPTKVGPSQVGAYLMPYLTFVLPNTLFAGAIFFVLATLTRQALSTYVGSIIFLVLYFVAQSQLSDLDNKTLASLLDPMGNGALSLLTKYWTPAEKNTRLITPTGLLGLNRLLWLGVGLLLVAFCYLRFRFGQSVGTVRLRRPRPEDMGRAVQPVGTLVLPQVQQDFGTGQHLRQWARLTWQELRDVLRSPYFIAIVVAGLAFLLASALQIGKIYDTQTYPVTEQVIEILSGSFTLFLLAIITFYAGELVWRERDAHMNQLYDALPIPNWVPLASKLAALLLVPVVLLVVVLVFGILTQLSYGYYQFEIGLYLRWLFGLKLLDYWLLVVLAVVVQVVVNNKYLGHLVMVLYYLFVAFLAGQVGLEHNLLLYGSDPGVSYSALNGFGHFIGPYFWFKSYWAALAVVLAVGANLLWVRGTETTWATRQQLAQRRFSTPVKVTLTLALLAFVGLGAWIFYNTNVLNKYRTGKQDELDRVAYEKQYKRLQRLPQPRIVAVNVQVDLFPERQEARAHGQYWVLNKTQQPIDSVVLDVLNTARIRKLQAGPGARNVLADTTQGLYVQRLPRPLAPGDSLALSFDLYYPAPGFENRTGRTSIVENGTFINSAMMPHLGYSEGSELSEESARKKYGLKPKPRMRPLGDTAARQNTYIAHDADWVRFAATVSTVPDQIALAPGYLQKEWQEGGRRYFRYAMDAPILNFYSFQSARYAVRQAKWNNVDISIYYQPGHEYNLDRMIRGVKDGLAYYSKNFSPYQHRQVRIVEFPGYSSFAQSFPNTIPFSENIGFIAKVDTTNPNDVDYPYYVTAHEVAHQWWAHQVIGADAQGSTLMVETLAQYSALMVMKQKYGEAMMRKFLKYEMDSYLGGRAQERRAEQPLYKVENQQYIHYRKGSVVMYALADYIGEDKVNQALSDYIKEVQYQEPPYTTSLDLVRHLRQVTPDSLQYLITDMFERITLYENRADSVTARKLPNGQYRVDMVLSAKKVYADSLGNETPAKNMNDLIDVGVLARKKINGQWQDVTLYRQKRRFRPGTTRLSVTVPEKPAKAGIDPFNLLIDRTPSDNLKDVTIEK